MLEQVPGHLLSEFLVKGVISSIGRLLSFDPVINPIITNLPVSYWSFLIMG
jgi:hypothetical protein